MSPDNSSKKSIAFIICPHGFGHIRRVSEVFKELVKDPGRFSISIYTRKDHYATYEQFISSWFGEQSSLASFVFEGMDKTPTWTNDDYTLSAYSQWVNDLSAELQKQQYDLVISDNLAGIAREKNVMLEGSFLWSEIFSGSENNVLNAISETETTLLEQTRPEMLCLERMAMHAVKTFTRPIYTNWWCDKTASSKTTADDLTVLITGGGTTNAEKALLPLIETLRSRSGMSVVLDKRLMKAAGLAGEPFSFSDEAFAVLGAIIARPGIGILTEAVKYNIPLICFGESDHPELIHNAKKWEEAGFGFNCMNHDPAVIYPLLSPAELNKCRQHLLNEPGGGHVQAAGFIMKKLYHD